MRLREHTVFFRLATRRDLVDAGEIVSLLDDLIDRGAQPSGLRDATEVRGIVRPFDAAGRQALVALAGAGFHQRVNWEVSAEAGAVPLVTVHTGAHPYAGDWLTLVDVRVSTSQFEREADAADWVRWWCGWIERAAPIWAAAHDTDDQGMQNCTLPSLLRTGYGLETWNWDVAAAPGREVSRGLLRMAPNWLTWFGDEALERLALHRDDASLPPSSVVGNGRLWQLSAVPGDLFGDAGRAQQRALREALGFDRLAVAERWTQGYWQRR